jgi:WD40 repeat protein
VTTSEGAADNAAVWDVASGRLLHTLAGHSGTVTSGSFSSDGRWIVTAGPSSAAIWGADDGKLLFYLRGATDLLTDAAWAPRGYRLATAEQSGMVREYRCLLCRPLSGLQTLAEKRAAAAV